MSRSTVFVKYHGFYSDWFMGAHLKDRKPMKEIIEGFVPNSKVVKFSFVSYLTQKGFGPGYFNNSAVYNITFQISANIPAEEIVETLKKRFTYSHDMKFYDTAEDFVLAKKEQKAHAKYMNKIHPY